MCPIIRTAIYLTGLFISSSGMGQIRTQALTNAALPKNIGYQGKLVQTIHYHDKTGSYIALTAQTGIRPQAGNRQAHLYAYVYRLNGDIAPTLLWQLHDQITDCPLDVVASFVPGTLAVTDLDKNDTAEVWTVYRISCQGDVSPSELKIIMHEGTKKYAIRGIGRIKVGNVVQEDGGIITSNDLKTGPAVFSRYASRLWDKWVFEVIR